MTPLTRTELDGMLEGAARAWLDDALAEAASHAAARTTAGAPPSPPSRIPPWEVRFAAAGRCCSPEHADAVRTLLLHEARADLETLTRLYRQGAAAERRAVLLSLPRLVDSSAALPLVDDALRTNDTRLLTAALGPYAAAHLDPHSWRQAVLKCLFTGVPLDHVHQLAVRARGDAELARMLTDYAAERTAAGRPVPPDVHRALALAEED
ncbi:EboA domain-containing protein [Streptomyces sp. HNM0663]|uniref:EboA domain-containing protein n=1 Tax=Streptomyces chengmaiensis TaxID=3040919 RepID=A0ABT6HYV6_9ACTN|nr:EboA domain-containing protein [Streptomyces chengmaiensis]MDH2393497.1 EboA domain-containing protein [Streptomyces chengmaiensis]